MDNLKSVWNQLNIVTSELGTIIETEESHSIYEKLKKEEELRKKYNPFLVIFILVITVMFIGMLDISGLGFSYSKIIGVVFITVASVSIAIFSQIVKIPLKEFEYNRSSIDFLKIVKTKLDKSKKMLVLGIILQITFLTVGLYFIIFHNTAMQNNSAYLFSFLGVMMGLGGSAVGGTIAAVDAHYREVYQKINAFQNI